MNNLISLFSLLTIVFLASCNNNQTNVKVISNNNTLIKENKKSTKVVPKVKTESKKCIDIVIEILETSPVYIEKTKGLYEAVVKNGGTSFGIIIEGSPNPKEDEAMDFSKTYDFSLHETYSDRIPVIARYTFNPADEQLYEYDVIEDKLNPIDFDRNLLLKFNVKCK